MILKKKLIHIYKKIINFFKKLIHIDFFIKILIVFFKINNFREIKTHIVNIIIVNN